MTATMMQSGWQNVRTTASIAAVSAQRWSIRRSVPSAFTGMRLISELSLKEPCKSLLTTHRFRALRAARLLLCPTRFLGCARVVTVLTVLTPQQWDTGRTTSEPRACVLRYLSHSLSSCKQARDGSTSSLQASMGPACPVPCWALHHDGRRQYNSLEWHSSQGLCFEFSCFVVGDVSVRLPGVVASKDLGILTQAILAVCLRSWRPLALYRAVQPRTTEDTPFSCNF